jgi:hypothetical protein
MGVSDCNRCFFHRNVAAYQTAGHIEIFAVTLVRLRSRLIDGGGNRGLNTLSRRLRTAAQGRDLPDADGPALVSLNGGFGEGNLSLIGQNRAQDHTKSSP